MHKSTASKIDQMRKDLSAIMAANGVLERVLRAHPYLEKHIKESCHGSLSVDKSGGKGAIFITVGHWPEYSREMYAAEREVNAGASEYALEQLKAQGLKLYEDEGSNLYDSYREQYISEYMAPAKQRVREILADESIAMVEHVLTAFHEELGIGWNPRTQDDGVYYTGTFGDVIITITAAGGRNCEVVEETVTEKRTVYKCKEML